MSIYCSVSLLFVLPVFSHVDTPHPRLNSAVVLTQCQPTAPFQIFLGDFANVALKDYLASFRVGLQRQSSQRHCWRNKSPTEKGGKLQLKAGAQLLNKWSVGPCWCSPIFLKMQSRTGTLLIKKKRISPPTLCALVTQRGCWKGQDFI